MISSCKINKKAVLMLRKTLVLILFFFILSNIYSEDLSFQKIKAKLAVLAREDIPAYLNDLTGKNVLWSGTILELKNDKINNSNIALVDMDILDKDFKKNIPDLFFIIPDKAAGRIFEFQYIRFSGVIENIDYTNDKLMIKVKPDIIYGVMEK
jgi:hypothetical protein